MRVRSALSNTGHRVTSEGAAQAHLIDPEALGLGSRASELAQEIKYLARIPTTVQEARQLAQEIIDKEGVPTYTRLTGLVQVPQNESDLEAMAKQMAEQMELQTGGDALSELTGSSSEDWFDTPKNWLGRAAWFEHRLDTAVKWFEAHIKAIEHRQADTKRKVGGKPLKLVEKWDCSTIAFFHEALYGPDPGGEHPVKLSFKNCLQVHWLQKGQSGCSRRSSG